VIVVNENTLAFASTRINAIAATPTKLPISGANTATVVQWEDPSAAARSAQILIGSWQSDSFQKFEYSRLSTVDIATGSGLSSPQAVPEIGSNTRGPGVQWSQNTDYLIFTNGAAFPRENTDFSVPRMSYETRPQNIYVNYIIKY
jgi:hypothetical protein